jgi:hypothetical protein
LPTGCRYTKRRKTNECEAGDEALREKERKEPKMLRLEEVG